MLTQGRTNHVNDRSSDNDPRLTKATILTYIEKLRQHADSTTLMSFGQLLETIGKELQQQADQRPEYVVYPTNDTT